jgi:RNA polymerase sigma-B factor
VSDASTSQAERTSPADRVDRDPVGLDLLRRYASTRDRAVRDLAFLHHRGLARSLAKRMGGRGIPMDDLLQVADIGLLGAIERFDPERGTPFVGYAVTTILGQLKKHFRDHGWGVRVPRPLKELHLRLRDTAQVLGEQLGRSPTTSELAEALGVSEERVLEAIEAGAGYRSGSTSSDEGASSVEQLVARRSGDVTAGADDRILLEGMLARLPARERRIVHLRFYEDLTQSEIAEQVGISQMHVSRLLRHTLEELRTMGEPAVSRAS